MRRASVGAPDQVHDSGLILLKSKKSEQRGNVTQGCVQAVFVPRKDHCFGRTDLDEVAPGTFHVQRGLFTDSRRDFHVWEH